MTCDECRILLDRCLEGSLHAGDRAALLAHAEECSACREQYEQIGRMQTQLHAAFTPRSPATDAATAVLGKLGTHTAPSPRPTAMGVFWSLRRGLGMAAVFALAIMGGFFLGTGWSRATVTARIEKPSGSPVPIQVVGLKGTVLVERSANAAWSEMTSASPLYVGDVFQASPKSEMTLAFKDGSTMVLSANSRLSLEHYNGGTRLNLGAGQLKASLNSPHPPFIVSTPSGQLEALGTEFTVSVE
jgi:ferric-dicitrate binding protein FerR (iron transport regulator)